MCTEYLSKMFMERHNFQMYLQLGEEMMQALWLTLDTYQQQHRNQMTS